MPTIIESLAFGIFPADKHAYSFASGDIFAAGQSAIIQLLCEHFATINAPLKNTQRFALLLSYWRDGGANYLNSLLFDFASADNEFNDEESLPSESWQWQANVVGRAKYVGSIAKRISKWTYQLFGIKLPADIISRIGNIAADYTAGSEVVHLDFTRQFNWRAGEYGDNGSCFWQGRAAAREAMADNGARAIRFYDDDTFADGIGRAWVLPHDMSGNRAWIVFNAYGPHCHNTCGRILAQLWGATYRRIDLENEGSTDGTLYINSGRGTLVYLASDSEVFGEVSSIDFGIDCDEYGSPCAHCGDACNEDNCYTTPNGETCCESCYCNNYTCCERCNDTIVNDDSHCVNDQSLCDHCLEHSYRQCSDCGEYHPRCDSLEVNNGDYICQECAVNYSECAQCGEVYSIDDITTAADSGDCFCADCLADEACVACECSHCGEVYSREVLQKFSADYWYGALANSVRCIGCLNAPNQLSLEF